MGGAAGTIKTNARSSRASTLSTVSWVVFFIGAGVQLLAPFIPGVALIVGFFLGEIYWYCLAALYGIATLLQLVSSAMYFKVYREAKKSAKVVAYKAFYTSLANFVVVSVFSLIFVAVLFSWI